MFTAELQHSAVVWVAVAAVCVPSAIWLGPHARSQDRLGARGPRARASGRALPPQDARLAQPRPPHPRLRRARDGRGAGGRRRGSSGRRQGVRRPHPQRDEPAGRHDRRPLRAGPHRRRRPAARRSNRCRSPRCSAARSRHPGLPPIAAGYGSRSTSRPTSLKRSAKVRRSCGWCATCSATPSDTRPSTASSRSRPAARTARSGSASRTPAAASPTTTSRTCSTRRFRGTSAREAEQEGDPTGAGMGLTIAHGLVDAQHGSIGVQNLDDGCRFEVRLPAVSGF